MNTCMYQYTKAVSNYLNHAFIFKLNDYCQIIIPSLEL